ncbi:MAG: phosphonate C-P lyase system protein PhnG [Cyanobacteria bacterium Co-bin13]|nr:phosphonate C-P lyase system protein PhnG [Cyanobacteria bacterium Co-bin13]
MQTSTPRQIWMATLAKAPAEQLEQCLAGLGNLPAYDLLRPAETGLAMVRGRAGGTGQAFNLGEMTMTRCVVQLAGSASDPPISGFSYVAGRSKRHAELAALCDALLQHTNWHETVWANVIEPIQTALERQRQQQTRQVEATRVNFFTMVRGE